MGMPFNYKSEVTTHLPDNFKNGGNEIIDEFEEQLYRLRVKNIVNSTNSISFNAGPFRLMSGMNFGLLSCITKGEIVIHKYNNSLSAKYDIRFTEILILVTLVVSLIIGPLLLLDPAINIIEALLILGVSWMWLFGGNVVITIIRFPLFVRKTINKRLGFN